MTQVQAPQVSDVAGDDARERLLAMAAAVAANRRAGVKSAPVAIEPAPTAVAAAPPVTTPVVPVSAPVQPVVAPVVEPVVAPVVEPAPPAGLGPAAIEAPTLSAEKELASVGLDRPAAAAADLMATRRRRGDARKLRPAKTDRKKTPVRQDQPKAAARTGTWTAGSALASKAASVVIAVALVAGPVALGLSLLPDAPQAASRTSAGPVAWEGSTVAAERARELVTVWLTATRDDDDELLALYPQARGQLPTAAAQVRDVAVAEVVDQGTGVWAVTIGADVLTGAPAPATEEGGAAAEEVEPVWVRRYFLVPVAVGSTEAGMGAQILALPAPVAGPVVAEGARLDYPSTQTTTGPMGQAVTDFLTALVAGQGDVTRYVAPGTVIRPVTPAPYQAVALTRLSSTSTEADVDAPADGESLSVLADVELADVAGQEHAAQYVLELTARAGRWEISGLGQRPTLDEEKSGRTPGEQTGVSVAPTVTDGAK